MNAAAQGVVRFYDLAPAPDSFLDAVIDGLGHSPKRIPQKFLYDARGYELQAQIRELHEYFVARAEMRIMIDHIGEMAEFIGADTILIEMGINVSHATRVLAAATRPQIYVPLDPSAEHIRQASGELHAALPWLNISGVCADYTKPQHLPEWSGVAYWRKAGYLSGPVFSGFTSGEAFDFLRLARDMVGADGALLIGVDLKVDARVLHAAYNDAQGITGKFNLNLLERMNRELGADFKPQQFAHHAVYDSARGRIEMHIKSKRAQSATIINHVFDFAEGENIHTATASKYTVEEFQNMAREAGFNPAKVWVDAERQFSVHGLSVA
jgi:dimethylhistidine N-methyltransferase